MSRERSAQTSTRMPTLSRPGAWSAVVLVLAALLAPATATAQQADGERLFQQRCGSCHSLDPSVNRVGPNLAEVIGRTAGSVDGARYSDAMQGSGIVWDAATLDTFVAGPRRMVPGTTMSVSVPDATQRAAIIAYLESL